MTTKLYYTNSYLDNFSSKVIECTKTQDGFLVVLQETAFYPEGGGQPSDTGYLLHKKEEITVLSVFEKDDIVYHTTNKAVPVGVSVSGYIDFDRRFDFMQQHTGEHILCGIVNHELGYDNVGFHIGKEEVLVDFSGVLTKENIDSIQFLANKEIYLNNPVTADYPDNLSDLNYRSKKELTGKVRIVKAGDSDLCACCGTHTSSTGEVGAVIITGFIAYKGGTRITMLCGKRAIDYYTKINDTLFEINKLLSKNNDTILDGVKNVLDTNAKLRAELSQTKQKLFKALSMAAELDENILLYSYDYLNSNEMQSFAKCLAERSDIAMLVSLQEDKTYKIIITSSKSKAREIGADITTTFNGKGGGSKESFQGFIKDFTPEFVITILKLHK